MKKFILIFIFLIIFYKNVNAITLYGDYYKVDTVENVDSDLINVKSYKVYNTYDILYEDMGYLEDNTEYIKDEDDFIEVEEKILEYQDDSDEYINVKTLTKERNVFSLGNIKNNLQIYEMEIYFKDKKIDYRITNMDEYKNYPINIINDGDFINYYTQPFYPDSISVLFDNIYNLEDIKIVLYTKKNVKNSSMKLFIDDRPVINLNNECDRKHIITFTFNGEGVDYSYVNRKKLYKYYKENIIKSNNYKESGNNIILDDYKIINEYYKRDKLVIKDNIVITRLDTDINDYILYKSGDVKVSCDINYQENGMYKCRFVLNDITYESDVLINIEKQYNKELTRVDNEMDKNNVLVNIEKEQQNNKLVLNNNALNIKLNRKVKNRTIKNNFLENNYLEKIQLSKVVIRKKNNYRRNIFKTINIIVLVNLYLIFYLVLKRKRYNVE